MTTRLTQVLTYDAPLATVATMLADPAFREAVCDAQGVVRRTVRITGSGTGMVVVVDSVQAAHGIPSYAARFVGDEIAIVQTETWTSPSRADLSMEIPGKPGEIEGTIRLEESDGTTTETVAVDIKVGIPLVGGKVETLVADLLRAAFKAENQVGRTWLA